MGVLGLLEAAPSIALGSLIRDSFPPQFTLGKEQTQPSSRHRHVATCTTTAEHTQDETHNGPGWSVPQCRSSTVLHNARNQSSLTRVQMRTYQGCRKCMAYTSLERVDEPSFENSADSRCSSSGALRCFWSSSKSSLQCRLST
jgi:hypothetical protein